MRSLHRATTTHPPPPSKRGKGSGNVSGSGGGSLRLRLILLIVTTVALCVFAATQLYDREGRGSGGFGKTHRSVAPKKVVGKELANQLAADSPPELKKGVGATNPHYQAAVFVGGVDANVANKEHPDDVGQAVQNKEEGSLEEVGEHSLAVKLDALDHKEHAVQQAIVKGNVGRGLQCPPFDLEAFDRELQIPLRHLPRRKKTSVGQKYDRRAHNCAGDGIWNRVTIKDHHAILQNIARLARIRQGAFVFDWGSGCGHQLEFLTKEFGATGVGIDVSNKTVAYAVANTSKANLHCVADGTKLEWIPSNFFDHAYSFGSIYHVYNRSKFCHVLRQMARIVKPGGTVYNGWTENAEYRREHVGMCLADLPVTFTIYEEAIEFKQVQIFPLKASQTTPNTYSLVISKLLSYDQKEFDQPSYYTFDAVPIHCGVHKCEPKEGVKLYNSGAAVLGAAVGVNGAAASAGRQANPGEADETAAANEAPPKKGDSPQRDNDNDVASGEEWSFDGWPQCPAYDARMEELQIPLEHLPRKKKTSVGQKYDRRAHNCAANGVWHKIDKKDHKEILSTIGKTIKATKGDVVFDWGCGCGHQLEFMYNMFGARGLGIDVSNLTIAYAVNSTVPANRFCVADGTRLDWIPDNFFDKAYSFGSIYHVYDIKKFCSVLRQMVRIVKPGGLVYNGWTENGEFHRDYVVKCVNTDDDSWMPEKERSRYEAAVDNNKLHADADAVETTVHHLDVDPDKPDPAPSRGGAVVPLILKESVSHAGGTVVLDPHMADEELAAAKTTKGAATEIDAKEKKGASAVPDKVKSTGFGSEVGVAKEADGDDGDRRVAAADTVSKVPLSLAKAVTHVDELKTVAVDPNINDPELAPRAAGEGKNTNRRKLQAAAAYEEEHIVDIIPEKDLFASVETFPLKAKRTSRSTYSVLIRKAQK